MIKVVIWVIFSLVLFIYFYNNKSQTSFKWRWSEENKCYNSQKWLENMGLQAWQWLRGESKRTKKEEEPSMARSQEIFSLPNTHHSINLTNYTKWIMQLVFLVYSLESMSSWDIIHYSNSYHVQLITASPYTSPFRNLPDPALRGV